MAWTQEFRNLHISATRIRNAIEPPLAGVGMAHEAPVWPSLITMQINLTPPQGGHDFFVHIPMQMSASVDQHVSQTPEIPQADLPQRGFVTRRVF